jgi:hypothetical protein
VSAEAGPASREADSKVYPQADSKVYLKIYQALAFLTAFGVLLFLTLRPGLEGDSQALVEGSVKGLECMQRGQWIRCPEVVGPFAVFQYLPCWILEVFGASKELVIHSLAYLSMVTGVFGGWTMFKTLQKRGASLAWFGMLLMSGGYWMRYLNMSFGEMIASFFTLMFVISHVSGKSVWKTGAFLFAATLTKDTAFIFLLLWVWVMRKDAVKLSAAVVAGLLVSAAFNLFRYGTLINHGYTDDVFFVREIGYQISFFFAQWFSPAGGMLVFWPSFAILLGIVLYTIFRVHAARKVPGLLVFAILGGLTLGFSKWYAPLGGSCWGDRFLLPWIPGLSFYALWSYSDEFTRVIRSWAARPRLFWGVSVGLAVATFPQYAFLLRQSLIGKVMLPPSCSGLSGFAYENCRFWHVWPWGIMEFYTPLPRWDLFLLTVFMCSWVIAICLKMRSQVMHDIPESLLNPSA